MFAFPMDGCIVVTLLSMLLAFGLSLVQLLRGLRVQKTSGVRRHD